MAALDVDRDSDLDLVFGCIGQDRLCLNDGSGVFTDATALLSAIMANNVASRRVHHA